MEQRVHFVRTYYTNNCSMKDTLRALEEFYGPSFCAGENTVLSVIQNFEETGSVNGLNQTYIAMNSLTNATTSGPSNELNPNRSQELGISSTSLWKASQEVLQSAESAVKDILENGKGDAINASITDTGKNADGKKIQIAVTKGRGRGKKANQPPIISDVIENNPSKEIPDKNVGRTRRKKAVIEDTEVSSENQDDKKVVKSRAKKLNTVPESVEVVPEQKDALKLKGRAAKAAGRDAKPKDEEEIQNNEKKPVVKGRKKKNLTTNSKMALEINDVNVNMEISQTIEPKKRTAGRAVKEPVAQEKFKQETSITAHSSTEETNVEMAAKVPARRGRKVVTDTEQDSNDAEHAPKKLKTEKIKIGKNDGQSKTNSNPKTEPKDEGEKPLGSNTAVEKKTRLLKRGAPESEERDSTTPAPKTKKTANAQKDDTKLPSPTKFNKHYGMKICSWNVAGLRSWIKKDGLKFLSSEQADIFCLQETKCTTDQLPEEAARIPGYHPYWLCLPGGYAGVAIYSKIMPINVDYGIGDKEFDSNGRIITAEYEKFFLINVYVPNSGRKLVNLELRMRWEKLFQQHVQQLDKHKPVIICGDMNVSHHEIDLANPKGNSRNAGFTKEEREKMTELLSLGYVDTFRHLYPKREGAYTFWTYMSNARARNVGWRLDYFIVSDRFMERVSDSCICSEWMGSDHCPITLLLKV